MADFAGRALGSLQGRKGRAGKEEKAACLVLEPASYTISFKLFNSKKSA
jgi:hypothetical protein